MTTATPGYLTVLSGKAKSKKSRNVPLSERIVKMLSHRGPASNGHVFHRPDGSPWPNSHLGQRHSRVRAVLKIPSDFVLHSLRYTFGTRLGESGADAFTIMRLMGHSTVTVSQRYVHPSPEAIELAYERMTAMNLRRLPQIPPQSIRIMLPLPDKLFVFNVPGWRNRQTQRT